MRREYFEIDGAGISPTLEVARQRLVVPRDPPASAPRVEVAGALATTLAIAISWLAAGALVIGLAWIASTLERRAQIPAGTLPYALAWSGAAAAALVTSVASLFASSRRVALLGTAAVLAATMVAAVALRI